MCSLVNAKSGGCAEDCGFCAQSKFADAETPMHAMMEPDQILEHARAAEAAGAHRFCMVTQGQGLSKRDFEKVARGRAPGRRAHQPQALRVDRPHVRRPREAAEGSRHPARPPQRRDGAQLLRRGLDHRQATKAASARSRRSRKPASRPASAASSTSARAAAAGRDGIRAGRAGPDQRPDQPAQPARGTKFGDRDLIDPWDAVKFIAIFRLILPEALFRLCGGRVENLGELQPLAVKAGLNGVMMGNFLTTLGSEPEDDRAMFEELGLNVARQDDNGANPRPDNRSGWLDGETPATPMEELSPARPRRTSGIPSTQLRMRKKSKPPAYPPSSASRLTEHCPEARGDERDPERLEELRELGLYRRMRMVPGPQGPRVLLDGKESCCSAPTTTSGWPTTRGCATAAARGGDALRRRRRRLAARVGQHDAPPPPRGAPGRVQGVRSAACCSAPATSPTWA